MPIGKKLTHKEFLDNLYEKNEYYRNGEFEVIGEEYINNRTKITLKTKYGLLQIAAFNLLMGQGFDIRSALNKTEYFINRAKELHENKYDYSKVNYKTVRDKIEIICDKHGVFMITPNGHLNGNGCEKCGREIATKKQSNTTEEFIQKAKKIHGDKFDYSKVNYINAYTKIKINCAKHGVVKVIPHNHLNKKSHGCPRCFYERPQLHAKNNTGWGGYQSWENFAKKSKYFDSFKLYIIKCWNDNEEFYKIGRTFGTIKGRFHHTTILPYNYEVIKLVKGSAEEICNLEAKLKKQHTPYKYIPKIFFRGRQECFNTILEEYVEK